MVAMASDSPSEVRDTLTQARGLGLALDAIEAQLDSLDLGANADAVAKALAGPIRAFDAAASAALREASS